MDPKIAHGIFINIIERVKDGEVFVAQEIVSEIIGNDLEIKLIDSIENNRKVLRIIVPDKYGNLEQDQMEEPFDLQYES
jgi:hypothetical protein